MIDINEVIYGLEFTKAMITFNPLTGEDVEPENLNEDNKITYDACVGAITLLKEQNRLIAEARNEGYNEAYRSYCVEVAEEDQDLRRILPYVDRGDEDDPEM